MRPITHTVYLIFMIDRVTLEITHALLTNSANPCIDHSRFFPSTFGSWDGSSHDHAYGNAAAWLRSETCHLPEAIRKMALPQG